MITAILEILGKLLTIAASPGGLTFLQNHVRSDADIQAALDAAIKQTASLPPPS